MSDMGYSHFLYEIEASELHAAMASICVKAGATRVIW